MEGSKDKDFLFTFKIKYTSYPSFSEKVKSLGISILSTRTQYTWHGMRNCDQFRSSDDQANCDISLVALGSDRHHQLTLHGHEADPSGGQ